MVCRGTGDTGFEQATRRSTVTAVGQHLGQRTLGCEFRVGAARGNFQCTASAGQITQMLIEATEREPSSGLAGIATMLFQQDPGLVGPTGAKRRCCLVFQVPAKQALASQLISRINREYWEWVRWGPW